MCIRDRYYMWYYTEPEESLESILQQEQNIPSLEDYLTRYSNSIFALSITIFLMQFKMITSFTINEDTNTLTQMIGFSLESLIAYTLFVFSVMGALAVVSQFFYGPYIVDFKDLVSSFYSIFAIFSLSDYRIKHLIFLYRPGFSLIYCGLILAFIFWGFNQMFSAIMFDSLRYRNMVLKNAPMIEGSLQNLVLAIVGRFKAIAGRFVK
eukprot:TRINITY_DN25289_c0_g1_i1.p1 TRINITY_DN25289_c0_g1~~TRINITY_DN25289_c0_g1_i1.p1  ORF type:complete len:227 (+),score=53.76 TRINITY_DN25289_c0_g1_i1:60-683(+)